MTTDTKVADLPAKWRAKAKRIRGMTAGSDLVADIMEGSAEDLEAALARQDAVAWRYWNEKSKSWNTTCSEVVAGVMRDSGRAVEPLYAAPPAAQADDDWHLRGYEYASKQATTCAGCGEHKHTPLRIDAMGGYVCLTCIDNKLSSLLGEFGYTAAQAVDLEQFRGAVEAYKAAVNEDCYFDPSDYDDNIAYADRLLTLIDQQAGKAGGA